MSIYVNHGTRLQFKETWQGKGINFCGDCVKWMKTNVCPKEKGFQKSMLNPSIATIACDAFEPINIPELAKGNP